MKCIDAIEGTAKATLVKFLDVATEFRMDASEYIRNVKAVIAAVTLFVKDNPEVSEMPDLITDELYDYAKTQWLKRIDYIADANPGEGDIPDLDYQAYCYDYIYAHGDYPR
jgi:hypothetical protein